MRTQIQGLVEQFKAEAAKAGAMVHEASTTEEIRSCVLKLAQERSVKHVVKSNSKVADGIELRGYLESAGIEVIETDFKQRLTQLAGGEQAARRTIAQVAKLISKVSGQELAAEPQILLNVANRIIRQYCIDADMGISQAGAAIAETGTLVIVGNEGVGRLVAVLPRIHVTLVEAQDVVPVMEGVFIKLNKRPGNKTGQAVPSYVTYITGRNTTADIPGAVLARAQGPAEEHIVIFNENAGRSGA
jgi:L-lactate dehydrogenase complex protein LldF